MSRPDLPWRERVQADGMRPVFHALTALGPDEDPLALLDHVRGRRWVRDVAARVAELSVAARAVPYEPGDERLLGCLWELYAAGRVRDVLLLPHQPPPLSSSDEVRALDDRLGRVRPAHRPVPVEAVVEFFVAVLGCVPVADATFTPALHEIVHCEDAGSPDAPVEILDVVWPALVVADLVVTRGGVRVRAGRRHAVPGVADRSVLHWEYWRRHRATSDESMGWGSSSQWRTRFRRDYVTDRGAVYDLDALSRHHERIRQDLLAPRERGPLSRDQADLVKNRCDLRVVGDPGFVGLHPGIDERR